MAHAFEGSSSLSGFNEIVLRRWYYLLHPFQNSRYVTYYARLPTVSRTPRCIKGSETGLLTLSKSTSLGGQKATSQFCVLKIFLWEDAYRA